MTGERGTILIRDAGAVLHAGSGCTLDGDAVRCRQVSQTMRAVVAAGDRDDRVTLAGDSGYLTANGGAGNDVLAMTGSASGAVLNGGAGDDRLQAASNRTTLAGGPGRDLVLGGPADDTISEGDDDGSPDLLDPGSGGRDHLTYGDRQAPITVDLQAGVGGQLGENDTVLPGFEWVDGGAVANVLLGSDADELLVAIGAAQPAVIDGRGGNDQVTGSPQADRLGGGTGDDRVDTGGGDDRVDLGDGDDFVITGALGSQFPAIVCGSGNDQVDDNALLPAFGADCETIQIGPLTVLPRVTGDALTVRVNGRAPNYDNTCALRTTFAGRTSGVRVANRRAAHLTLRASVSALPLALTVRSADRCRGRTPRWDVWIARLTLIGALPIE